MRYRNVTRAFLVCLLLQGTTNIVLAQSAERTGYTVTDLGDGRSLIAGGENASGLLGSIELLDADGANQVVGHLTSARKHQTATRLADGRVLFVGGEGTDGFVFNAEIFDLNTGQTSAISLSTGRRAHSAALLKNGSVLVSGGNNGERTLSSLELFDPATGTFTELTSTLIAPREQHSSTLLADGRILLTGGRNAGGPLASTEFFNLVTNQVSAGPAMNGARYGHTATSILHGDVVIIGGANETGALSSAEFYCAADGIFLETANRLQAARYGHATVELQENGYVLIVGGRSNDGPVNAVEMINPSNFLFSTVGTLSAPREEVGLTIGDNEVLAVASRSGEMAVERIRFGTVTTDLLDYPPDSPVTFSGAGWQPGEQVNITIRQSDGDPDTVLTSVADAAGVIRNTEFRTATNDGGVTFFATAIGSISRRVAVREFFDNHFVTSVSPSSFVQTTSPLTMSILGGGFTSGFNRVVILGTSVAQINCCLTDTQIDVTVPSSIANTPGFYSVRVSLSQSFSFCHFHSIFFQCHVHTQTETHDAVGPNFQVRAADTTPPVIQAIVNGPQGSNGWYIGNVTVSWSLSDPQSSISFTSGCGTSTINFDTGGFTVGCSATSAGGTSNASVTIRRDSTGPTIVAMRSPLPNTAGWNNTDVTINFSCTDSLSGVASGNQTQIQVVTSEDAGQSISRGCVDIAGNGASASVTGIDIDKTRPIVTGTPDRGSDQNGWYNHGVTVSWSGTDGLSGITDCSAASSFSGPDTSTAAVSGSCSDRAGNVGNASVSFKYDATAPNVTISSPTSGGVYVLNSSATASFVCFDALSGLMSCSGSTDNGGQLPTSMVGSRSLNVTATDQAGNVRSSAATYLVQYASSGGCLNQPGHVILEPVNADGTSVFKQGRTVPAKFRVCDATGRSVGDVGVVTDFQLIQVTNGTVTNVNETVPSTTPYDGFRWDPSEQQWIFNGATGQLQANRTYLYRVSLNDGTFVTFQFGLR